MKISTIAKVVASAVTTVALVVVPAVTAQAATQSANSTVNAIVSEVISLSVSGNVTINATPGGGVATGAHTVTVSTNNATGYNLNLSSSTTATTLAKGADSIAASAAPFSTPVALATDTWGYRVNSFAANTYVGIVANNGTVPTIHTSTTPVTSEATPVTWAVNVTTAKPSGTYTREVTYTAVTRS